MKSFSNLVSIHIIIDKLSKSEDFILAWNYIEIDLKVIKFILKLQISQLDKIIFKSHSHQSSFQSSIIIICLGAGEGAGA